MKESLGMCNCGSSRRAPSASGTSRTYDLILPSGRRLGYLTARERDAAHAATPGSTVPADAPR